MTSHFRGRFAPHRLFPGMIGLLVFVAVFSVGAQAYTHKILYSFCAKTNCTDGSSPYGGLTMDSTGALFGTTAQGGAHSWGTVFKLTPNAKRTSWKLETLYSFCAKKSCVDGQFPNGALVLDTQGNLYGTTYQGGAANSGLVFKLTPLSGQSRWRLTRLHDFVSGGADGYFPAAALTYSGAQSGALYDGISPLYGTTTMGGGVGNGTVFSVTPIAGKTRWKEDILHAFPDGDGALLVGGVIFGGDSNLYGAAYSGGSAGFGTVFELSPNAGKTRWTTTVLHNFCEIHCTDGEDPFATVTMDASGSLFGTTTMGGANTEGVIYKLVPKGANSQLTVLYNFCSQANCADGRKPGDGTKGPLAIDASGNLFGTTRYGGDNGVSGDGIAYKLNGTTQTVLYTFCAEVNCTDGSSPSSGLISDGSNNLIGTTDSGGAYAGGTIYELTP